MKNKFIVFGFLMIIFSIGAATLFTDDRSFSPLENRVLKSRPKITATGITSGKYMSDVESYLSDQIWGKDTFVKAKCDTDYLMFRQGGEGVYFGKHGYYVKDYTPKERQYKKNLELIEDFAARCKKAGYPVTMLLAPNVQSVLDVLPADIHMPDADRDYDRARKVLTDVNLVSPEDELIKHKNDYIYFRTDHHWTMEGAYWGYSVLCDALGLKADHLQSYEKQSSKENFYGSLYSRAPLSWARADHIETYLEPGLAATVTFEDGSTEPTMFMTSNLYKKDAYTYFLDGNHPDITIKSNCGTGKKALILKDSYSHCLIPFLAGQYDEIRVLDLRYFHDDVMEKIRNGKYDDVIMIYNMDFITTDTSFIGLAE